MNGLPFRLIRDLESTLPDPLASCVHVVDPRLMTGRSDAVIGAAYVRKWTQAEWITRRDYILNGDSHSGMVDSRAVDCSPPSSELDDAGSVAYSFQDNLVALQDDITVC